MTIKCNISELLLRADETHGKLLGSLRSFILSMTGSLTRPPISSSKASSSMSGTPPWFRILRKRRSTSTKDNHRRGDLQVEFVIRDFALHQLWPRCLAIVRKIKQMNHVGLLSQYCFPAKVNNPPEPKRLMILLPTVSDEDRVCLGERVDLEF